MPNTPGTLWLNRRAIKLKRHFSMLPRGGDAVPPPASQCPRRAVDSSTTLEERKNTAVMDDISTASSGN